MFASLLRIELTMTSPSSTPTFTLLIVVEVPEQTPEDAALFVAGDFNAWNPSNPRYRLEQIAERKYWAQFTMDEPEGRFKITRGSWETAEVDEMGEPVVDHHWFADDLDEPIILEVAAWLDQHPDAKKHTPLHTLTGEFEVLKNIHSPALNTYRDLIVYLPPSYRTSGDRRYPVIYAHDGQNLFDNVTAYAGEWEMDEICEQLASEEGIEFIVVGIPNAGKHRLHEYCPWLDITSGQGGGGKVFVNWLADDVKPLIDERFRTLRPAESTAMIGSSLGGLISLYAGLARPDCFGVVAALSPTVNFAGGRIVNEVTENATRAMNVYLDQGGQEYPGLKIRSKRLVEATEKLASQYVRASARVQLVVDPNAVHNEAAWSRRLPGVLRFIWSCVEH